MADLIGTDETWGSIRTKLNAAMKLQQFAGLMNRRATLTDGRAYPVMSSGQPTLTWYNSPTLSAIGLPTQWQYAGGRITLLGGVPTASSPGYLVNSRWFSNANGATTSPDYWAAEAIITDSVFGFYINGAGSNGFRVMIDGQLVSASPTTPSTGGYNALKIDCSALTPSRAQRHVRIEGWGGGCVIIGFLTSATGMCFPTGTSGLKFMVLGDSVADGTGNATWNGDGYPRLMGDQLSIPDLRVSADGGTGFITVSGSGKQNYQTRVADVIANAPDLLFTPLSSNDYGQTTSDMVTAVNSYITTIRASLPNLPIIIAGSPWNDGNLTNAQNIENAVATAIAARTDKYLAFVRTKTAGTPTAIISGQGTDTVPTGSGSSDYSWAGATSHPSAIGHRDIARYYAENTRRIVNAWAIAA